MRITFSQIASHRRGLSTSEAVGLVLAASREAERTAGAGGIVALPGADQIVLDSVGRVSFSTDPIKATEADGVNTVIATLRTLLPLDAAAKDGSRGSLPGPLLLLIARATGHIDLPAPSYSELRDTLARFGSANTSTRSSIYERVAGPRTTARTRVNDSSATAARRPSARQTAAPLPFPDRRKPGARVSDLRRELRDTELQLFEVLQRNRRLFGRFTPARAAVAASLAVAIALSFALTRNRQAPSEAPIAPGDAVTIETVDHPVVVDDPRGVRASRDPAEPGNAGTRLPVGQLLPSSALGVDMFSPSFTDNGDGVLFHSGRARSALMRASFDRAGNPAVATVLRDGAANYHGTLSPDGDWLAYDSDRDGTRGVYVARADASEARKISGAGYAAVPRWSPDGRRLAFVKAEPSRPRVWNLWVADLAGGTPTRVSQHRVGQAWGGSWFPDGQRLAYSVEDRLIIANLEHGTSRVLRSPKSGRLIRTPAVSPDGKQVVFQVSRDGAWLLDVATGTMRRVLSDATAEEFAWSPDGQRIVYHARQRGAWSLWQLALNAST